MLMTVPQQMTPQAETLLKMLRDSGDWTDRRALATAMGKTRLNKWDTALLDMLVDRGLVEVSKQPVQGAIGFEWIYRAK